MSQEILKSSREMRAMRLKILRKMSGLTCKDFTDKYNISFSNFQNWEGPRFGGLTEKGAKKILDICKLEGVEATLQWLMHGIEPGPTITENLYTTDKQLKTYAEASFLTENHMITSELALFEHNCKGQILSLVVTYNTMAPIYKIDDLLAGKRFFGKEIVNFLGSDCIIELQDNILVAGTLTSGSSEDLFTIIHNNQDSGKNDPALQNITILSAAPILFIRRKTPKLK